MMNEKQPKGPLDIARSITAEAEELDEFAMGQPELAQKELYGDFRQTVFDRDNLNPLLGERVIVYGAPLTLSVELEEESGDLITHPLAIASDQEYRPSSGIYCGLTVVRPYDAEHEKSVYRVVHIVYPGSSELCPDEHGNMQQTHYREYVLAKGSEVVPYNPVNAHSFMDLRDDPVASEIDKMVFDEEETVSWQLVEEVGLFAAMALSEHEHEDEKNQQRLSYLNSLNLLDAVELVTSDFMLGDKYHYETGSELIFNDVESVFVVSPHTFHFLNGYDRLESSGAVALWREPELFVEGCLDDGQTVLLPFQGIQGGYSAEWYD
jgi:hypothetical protein